MAGLKFKKNLTLNYNSGPESDDCTETASQYSGESELKGFESSDEDYTPNDCKRLRNSQQKNSKKSDKSTIERRPTRVPNPKVTNRNALMARENRKRKREIMENMEHELKDLQEENMKLKRTLKSKDSICQHLERERDYLKSVLANKTEITTILSALKTKIPQQVESSFAQVPVKQRTTSFTSSSSAVSSMHDDYLENGSISPNDPFLSDSLIDSLFTDTDVIEWDPLPMPDPFSGELLADIPLNCIDEKPTQSDAGICLHLNNGNISLEFCSECHYSAKRSFEKEPL